MTTWKAITRWAPATTSLPIAATLGDSVTKGARASTAKKTAPVSRTDRSTSDKTSISTSRTTGHLLGAVDHGGPASGDGRHVLSDAESCSATALGFYRRRYAPPAGTVADDDTQELTCTSHAS